MPVISDEEQDLCDAKISIKECKTALLKMKANKSPGTDGLIVEFYRYFWEDIKSSFISAFDCETLSCEQRRGVIRLIPKKGKDLTNVKNWRPISLLNIEYKLLTQRLANRLQSVLPSVISLD